ncbi:MAG: hypothetical protein KGJ78_06400 [Alphaproteobacteria bacterium]|nr:hypothetical protein [Alphaproteobacteria bacterium]
MVDHGKADAVRARVRKAVALGDYGQLYAIVPAMDGGQSNEMTCKICGGYGNVMGGPFLHEDGCPVALEEQRWRARSRNWFFRFWRHVKKALRA